MPELTFTVRWPDGTTQDCWSPSLVVHDHLAEGAAYSVEEFTRRARTALAQASERVRATYGHPCSSAMATDREITRRAAGFPADAPVDVLRLWPPLPPSAPPPSPGGSA